MGFGSDSFTQAFGSESQDMTSKSVLESERERQKDIEILTTKAQMVALEKQLKSIETDRKRGIIELESDGIEKQRKISKLGEEKEELYRELKYLMEKEESAREEAECLQKKLDKLQKQYKNEIDELKKANVRYGREMDEVLPMYNVNIHYHTSHQWITSTMNRHIDSAVIHYVKVSYICIVYGTYG